MKKYTSILLTFFIIFVSAAIPQQAHSQNAPIEEEIPADLFQLLFDENASIHALNNKEKYIIPETLYQNYVTLRDKAKIAGTPWLTDGAITRDNQFSIYDIMAAMFATRAGSIPTLQDSAYIKLYTSVLRMIVKSRTFSGLTYDLTTHKFTLANAGRFHEAMASFIAGVTQTLYGSYKNRHWARPEVKEASNTLTNNIVAAVTTLSDDEKTAAYREINNRLALTNLSHYPQGPDFDALTPAFTRLNDELGKTGQGLNFTPTIWYLYKLTDLSKGYDSDMTDPSGGFQERAKLTTKLAPMLPDLEADGTLIFNDDDLKLALKALLDTELTQVKNRAAELLYNLSYKRIMAIMNPNSEHTFDQAINNMFFTDLNTTKAFLNALYPSNPEIAERLQNEYIAYVDKVLMANAATPFRKHYDLLLTPAERLRIWEATTALRPQDEIDQIAPAFENLPQDFRSEEDARKIVNFIKNLELSFGNNIDNIAKGSFNNPDITKVFERIEAEHPTAKTWFTEDLYKKGELTEEQLYALIGVPAESKVGAKQNQKSLENYTFEQRDITTGEVVTHTGQRLNQSKFDAFMKPYNDIKNNIGRNPSKLIVYPQDTDNTQAIDIAALLTLFRKDKIEGSERTDISKVIVWAAFNKEDAAVTATDTDLTFTGDDAKFQAYATTFMKKVLENIYGVELIEPTRKEDLYKTISSLAEIIAEGFYPDDQHKLGELKTKLIGFIDTSKMLGETKAEPVPEPKPDPTNIPANASEMLKMLYRLSAELDDKNVQFSERPQLTEDFATKIQARTGEGTLVRLFAIAPLVSMLVEGPDTNGNITMSNNTKQLMLKLFDVLKDKEDEIVAFLFNMNMGNPIMGKIMRQETVGLGYDDYIAQFYHPMRAKVKGILDTLYPNDTERAERLKLENSKAWDTFAGGKSANFKDFYYVVVTDHEKDAIQKTLDPVADSDDKTKALGLLNALPKDVYVEDDAKQVITFIKNLAVKVRGKDAANLPVDFDADMKSLYDRIERAHPGKAADWLKDADLDAPAPAPEPANPYTLSDVTESFKKAIQDYNKTKLKALDGTENLDILRGVTLAIKNTAKLGKATENMTETLKYYKGLEVDSGKPGQGTKKYGDHRFAWVSSGIPMVGQYKDDVDKTTYRCVEKLEEKKTQFRDSQGDLIDVELLEILKIPHDYHSVYATRKTETNPTTGETLDKVFCGGIFSIRSVE